MNEETGVEEHTHDDKDGVIEFLTRELDHYKMELSITQSFEQRNARELIDYLIIERNSLRAALESRE